jgi:VanZ family protein
MNQIQHQISQRLAQWDLQVVARRFLGVVGLLMIAGMLGVGLWPFHSPKNQVDWMAGGNGLQFGRYGTILSSDKFRSADTRENSPCSIEIWLVPAHSETSATLFAFYRPEGPREFSLHQSISDLVLRSDSHGRSFPSRFTSLYVDDVFHQGKPRFITITSNGEQTAIYVDGGLARTAPGFPLSARDFQGELVVANSPTVDNSWSGVLRGFALYDQALSPSRVLDHFQAWIKQGQLDISTEDRPKALYCFGEAAGPLVRDQLSLSPDLYIPEWYTIYREVLLAPVWKEFHPTFSYWKDAFVNIFGFMPLGVVFCAYFSMSRSIKRPFLFTTLLGFGLSLTIEVIQRFLPTRDSSTTDVINNTLGTFLGVALCRSKLCTSLLTHIGSQAVKFLGQG